MNYIIYKAYRHEDFDLELLWDYSTLPHHIRYDIYVYIYTYQSTSKICFFCYIATYMARSRICACTEINKMTREQSGIIKEE